MNEILGELGEKYKDLDKNSRLALGEAIGGKTQINAVQALLGNWEQVVKFQQEYNQGQMVGSSAAENARFVDSIEGRVIKLKEELKKLVTTTISTDMFKGLVSGLTGVFSSINSVIGAFDKLGVATPVVLSSVAGLFSMIKSLGTGTPMNNYVKSMSAIATSGSKLNVVKSNLQNVSTQFTKISAGATKYSGTMRVASGSVDKFNNSIRTNGVVATQNSKGFSLMTKGASQAKSSLSGLGSSLAGIGSTLVSTLANTAIMAGVGIAISLAAQAWYDYAHAAEIAMEKHEENISKINTKISELSSQKSGLKAIAEEYDTLASKTNRTTEEQERYNELRNEIADLSPELLVGTDSDNNAILSLNGSLENYISNLDSAIKKQRELLMQQQNAEASDASDYLQKGVNRDSYKQYEQASVTADVETQKIAKSGTKVYNAIQKFTAASESSFETSIEKIQTARENHVSQIEESYNAVVEEQEKINEYSSKLKQKAINKVQTNSSIEKATDDIKTFAQNVTSSLDFSSLKTGEIDTFARNLGKSLSDGQIDSALLKYQQLRDELSRTGDTFTYEKSIKSLIPEMSKLLGLNEDIVASMVKLDPTLTQATSSLDSYLQSFGKRESMIQFDAETKNLAKQYNTFSSMLDDLGNLDGTENASGEVRFDLKAVAQIVNQDDVPKQVQDLFSKMQLDGQFDEDEMEIMMRISAAMTTDDSTQRKSLLEQAQQLIDDQFPNSGIDIGELDVEAEYRLNEASKKELADQIGEMGDKKFVTTIEAHVENFEQAENFKQLMSSLQGDKSKIQTFITANIDKLSEFENYEDMVKWILENPKIAQKYDISVVGMDTVDTVAKKVKDLDIKEDIKKKIMVEIQEGDLTGLQKTLSGLPEEKRTKVLTDISQALSGLNTVDAITLRDKIIELLAQDNASPTIMSVDARKLKTKTAQLGAKDNASSTINNLNNKKLNNKTMTITTILKTVKEKVSNFFSGGKASKGSLGGFSNVSDTPQQANITPMSTGFSNVSDTPTSSSVSSPSVPSRNQVSAKSVGSFGSVLTNPTLYTNISTSYKNVLSMIKYGINLFQELENRISRTGNQLDLLNIQMEGAVGTKKISYLKTQNKLYEEQLKLQRTLFNSLNNEKSSIRSSLQSQGFSFNSQGNFTSYEEQLLKLEQAYESAKNKEDAYTGSRESTKKKLAKATESANQKLDDAKKLTEKYLQLHYTDIPKAEQSWQDLKNSIKETQNEIERLDFENKIYVHQNAIEKLNNSLSMYQEYASRANTSASRYSGANKIKYMKEEISYTQKQLALTKDLMNQQQWQLNQYSTKLKNYGVSINRSTGEISNYDSILNKYQNSDDLDKVKQYMNEYMDLVESKLKANSSFEDLTSSMQDLNNEVNKLELEGKLSPFTTIIDDTNSKIKKLQDNLSIIDIKMNYAYGADKLNLLKQQLAIYKELGEFQKQSLSNMIKEESILKNELSKNGFNFDRNGDITNMKAALDKAKDSGAYEYINSVLGQWKDLHENEIPDATKSIEDFKNSVKDAYKEQLSITQEIEEKIKSIYEKQLEDRKDAIQKETDAIKKSLEDQKKAYQDMRKEVDYQNDYTEKTDNISKLQKKLENAKKDNSLGNKKKIADLEKELADARKDLEEFVQNKIDEDVENSIDNAITSVDESNDKRLEELEKVWSDSKIAEMISQSLKTGLFEGIDGTITNLQDAMLNFANTSGDLFGVMGKVVEEELVANLGIAVDTLRNYAGIMNELGLDKVNTSFSTGAISNRSVTTGDISINISTAANVNEQDIANKVKDALNEALQGAVQGL